MTFSSVRKKLLKLFLWVALCALLRCLSVLIIILQCPLNNLWHFIHAQVQTVKYYLCLPWEMFLLSESQLPWIEPFFSRETKSAELSLDVRVFGASRMCFGASSPSICE